jgi:hypothetical protein
MRVTTGVFSLQVLTFASFGPDCPDLHSLMALFSLDVHRPQPENSELVFVINCCVIFKDASDSLHRPSDAAGLRCLWNPVPAVDVNSVSYILSFFN